MEGMVDCAECKLRNDDSSKREIDMGFRSLGTEPESGVKPREKECCVLQVTFGPNYKLVAV